MGEMDRYCKKRIERDNTGLTWRCDYLAKNDGWCNWHHPDKIRDRKRKNAPRVAKARLAKFITEMEQIDRLLAATMRGKTTGMIDSFFRYNRPSALHTDDPSARAGRAEPK
jgi:hypothetical protein